MKKDLHPKEYRPVVYKDEAADFAFLTRSTAESKETIKWEDGKEYPLIKVHISSASHPFFTGQEKLVDVEGRVDRFKARMAAAKKGGSAKAQKALNKKPEEAEAQKLGAKQPKNKKSEKKTEAKKDQ